MSLLFGYSSEKSRFQTLLSINKAILICGNIGIGKTFFIQKILKELNYEIINVPYGNSATMEAFLQSGYKKRSTEKLVFVFDNLEYSLGKDKNKKFSKKKNKNISNMSVEEYLGQIILQSIYPLVFISQSKGNAKSKAKTQVILSRLTKLTSSIDLSSRKIIEIGQILDDKNISYTDIQLKEAYKKVKGNISEITSLLFGADIEGTKKLLTAQEFVTFCCSSKKQEAYNYIVSKSDTEIPSLFLLSWTNWNAFMIEPRDIKAAARLQRAICFLDTMKYGGVRNPLLSTFVHVLPEHKIGRLQFPNSWGIKKVIKKEIVKKPKEKKPKQKLIVRKTKKKISKTVKKKAAKKSTTKKKRRNRALL